MKININKTRNYIFSNGYCKIDSVLSNNFCLKLIDFLEKERKKLKKNKFFKDEASANGQIIIRDLIFRNAKIFLKVINLKPIIDILDKIFDEEYILDNIMASKSEKVGGNNYKRIAHIDSHIAINNPKNTLDVVAVLCLNNFNKKNGSTIIWPKSHLSGVKIQNEKKINTDNKKNLLMTAKRGSIIIFLGQTWHKIGENLTGEDRWGILLHYKRWWIKPATNFTKCGKKIFSLLNKKQKSLLGFNSISPEFNFKKKIRNLKTLRKISNVPSSYQEALKY
jgi:ectoine hydroxylase-related dioxygenase (phytanoyl-CoA dioxygenase family)